MHDDSDIDDQISDNELFDISDVQIEFQRTRGMCKVYMIMKSETPFNLLKYYLALKQYITDLENEIGILEENNLEEH